MFSGAVQICASPIEGGGREEGLPGQGFSAGFGPLEGPEFPGNTITLLGFAGVLAKPFKNCYVAVTVSVIGTCFLRFLCSFLSGVLLYASYAPEGTPAVIYSLGYNASYMVPEAIITVAVALVICAARPEILGMKRPAAAAAK